MQNKNEQKQAIGNAYDLFSYEYELRHPQPRLNVSRKRWTLRLLLGASVVASARHNIPFFVGQAGDGWTAFVVALIYAMAVVIMVEIGLVIFGEQIVEDYGMYILRIRPVLAIMGTILLLLVAFGSNVADGFASKDIFISETVKTVINTIANITAPLMAFIIGIMQASLDAKIREHDGLWQTNKNRAWQRHKKDTGIDLTVSYPRLPSNASVYNVSNQTDSRQTGAGYNRASTAVDNAKTWLLDNPEMMDKPLRQLAELIPDAGKDSIAKARNQIRKDRQNTDD